MTRFTNIIAAEIRPICAAFRAGSIEVPQGVAILMLENFGSYISKAYRKTPQNKQGQIYDLLWSTTSLFVTVPSLGLYRITCADLLEWLSLPSLQEPLFRSMVSVRDGNQPVQKTLVCQTNYYCRLWAHLFVGDGGAYPECHVAQYPLEMGKKKVCIPINAFLHIIYYISGFVW